MLRHITLIGLLTAFLATPVMGQAPSSEVRRDRGGISAERGEVDPRLMELLETWSQHSSRVRKLKGEVLRRTYGKAFGVERIAQGLFQYEAPDKGRLDVVPVKITKKLLDARMQPGANVQRNSKGQPYKLEPDANERWICDGQRLFIINDDEKEAEIVELPPAVQGDRIMNTPLPFLFGLPPEQALKRFHLELVQWNAGDDKARIRAIPRTRLDGGNWKQADVILDTHSWLPTDVQLIDPSGDRRTVYRFARLKANAFFEPIGSDPWKPNLKGYKVNITRDQNEQQVVPDLTGYHYKEAIERLKTLGIASDNIRKLKGGRAAEGDDELRVRSQDPPAGTPLEPNLRVSLRIWERQ